MIIKPPDDPGKRLAGKLAGNPGGSHIEITDRGNVGQGRPRRFIPKSKLKHGAYYLGESGKTSVARWNAAAKKFYYLSAIGFSRSVGTIVHIEDAGEDSRDSFEPFEETQKPIREIPLD